MTRVIVPVRYPLTTRSKRTFERAMRVAEDDDADLTVLHVNLYQNGHPITRTDLKRVVESEFGRLPNVRYVVRSGFLVEETILDEIAAEDADIVVIGHRQASRWKRLIGRLTRDPDIETFLKNRLDCTVITVGD
ncbi:universal stress protein [Halalkalicoccus subterraneus]|uniref:universal stress protein n=1 Tax=Halalkalicoccus subterraneus TaxID=2675002 RepID=UPI000EFD8B93|nr:universal stress protein [Halalkalicoccus subterraneus]